MPRSRRRCRFALADAARAGEWVGRQRRRGLLHPRHGQVRRRRAELLQRHRPDRAVRSGRARARRGRRAVGLLGQDRPQARRRSCRSAPPTAMSSAPTCGSGPIPARRASRISAPAALLYYESMGQNWERAALIKARAVAGDIAAGEAFLARARALHLAEVSRLRGDRRHPFDQAAGARASRPRRRSRVPATTSSSAAAASARSSSSCRRSS